MQLRRQRFSKELENILSSQSCRFRTYSVSQKLEILGDIVGGASGNQMAHSPDINFGGMVVLKDSWRVTRTAEVFLCYSRRGGCVFPIDKKPFGRVIDATDYIIPSDITMIKWYTVDRLFVLSWTRIRTIGKSNIRWESAVITSLSNVVT